MNDTLPTMTLAEALRLSAVARERYCGLGWKELTGEATQAEFAEAQAEMNRWRVILWQTLASLGGKR